MKTPRAVRARCSAFHPGCQVSDSGSPAHMTARDAPLPWDARTVMCAMEDGEAAISRREQDGVKPVRRPARATTLAGS